MALTRVLLVCGVAAGALFLAMDLLAAFWLYPGYEYTSQQVSELSAIGSPSREFWMTMGYPHFALSIAFAAGVWRAAAGRPSLTITALFLGLFAVNSLLWGIVAPMHMRGADFTATDTMHIVFAGSAVALMLGFMISGALSQGMAFRWFTGLVSIAMLAAGGIVSTAIPAIAAGEPTPWMGLVERVSVFAPMLWMAAFAVALLREQPKASTSPLARA